MVEVSGSSPLERIKKSILGKNTNLIEKIIEKYKKKAFLVAYSGGLDSTVLLHQLINIKKKKNNIQIRAIHINHNLNPNARKWVKHCKNTCIEHQIPYIIKHLPLHDKLNNIEEKLRIQRYNIIYKNLLKNEILLTGHHMNDQCETFFLSLKRGSGPRGLSCMSFQTSFGTKNIIRPFLNTTRKELELWAFNNKLKWIEDFSNLQIHYDRNFIRNQIIPILEKRWPYFIRNCFRTTHLCQKETNLLNYFLHKKIYHFMKSDESLNIQKFKNMKKDLCKALIRYWISLKIRKMPTYKVIQAIYYQMIFSQKSSNPKVVFKKYEIQRYQESLYFIKTQPDIRHTIIFWHNSNIQLHLPNNLGYLKKNQNGMMLPKPKKNELINIRFQYEGLVSIIGRNHSRKIKKIWQEKKIPPWLRNQIPLLFYNDILISALGVFIVNFNAKIKNFWTISWANDLLLSHNDSFCFC